MTEASRPIPKAIDRRTVLKGGLAVAASLSSPGVLRAATPTIRIGHVSPRTGPMAGFAEADPYTLDQIRGLLANGLQIGGKTYTIEIIAKDSQTDESRTAEVAAELILKDKVDHHRLQRLGRHQSGGQPGGAERGALHHHGQSVESYYYGHNPPKEGVRVDLPLLLGLDEVLQAFTGLWRRPSRPTRPWASCSTPPQDDTSWREALHRGDRPGRLHHRRSRPVPGLRQRFPRPRSPPSARPASRSLTGNLFTPDFSTFWTQAAQQGFHPKIVTLGKAFLFLRHRLARRPGQRHGLRVWWTPFPSSSSLTERSAPASWPAITRRRRAALDPADRLQARAVRGW